jgi:aarF domain-containing kinase
MNPQDAADAVGFWHSPVGPALVIGVVAAILTLVASYQARRAGAATVVALRYLGRGLRRRLRGERGIAPELLRHAFEDLGPTYLKLGQIIGSSLGLFPERYVTEFQKCLDRVRPFPFAEAERIVTDELGAPPAEWFAYFDPEPLASASIAQVHAARLASGRDVVVKIQRPAIAPRIDADLRFLHVGARILGEVPAAELANPVAIIEDFDNTIHQELDFLREAENMVVFNQMMAELGHEDIAAPEVITRLTTARVLVMERFRGVRIDDVASLRQRAVDVEDKLVRALRVWFQCMIIYGFFHGDVHAGNLLFLDDGRIGFIDFGIVGRFSEAQRRRVTEYIVAFASGDYVRLGQVMLEMGSVKAQVDLQALAHDLQVAYAPLVTRTFGELNYGEILPGLLRTAARHKMRLPSEFVLVTKQMLFFDRYAKLLAPDLNVFTDPRLVSGLREDVMRAQARTSASELLRPGADIA